MASIGYWANKVGKRRVGSVFFGGGTPSLMPIWVVESLIGEVAKQFSLASDAEITLEANPTSSATLAQFRKAGVNRLSVGVQSFEAEHLEFLGRTHSSSDAKRALEDGVRHFERVSFDLIYALAAHHSKGKWATELGDALRFATQLGISHFSAYQLTIEKNTEFYKNPPPLLAEGRAADLFSETLAIASHYGFGGYEISNFARSPADMCRHNLGYWQYQDYLGIGAGAAGRLTLGGKKYATIAPRDPQRWQRDPTKVKLSALSASETATEFVLMGLRLKQGVNKRSFKAVCGITFEEFCHRATLTHLTANGLLEERDGCVAIPLDSWIKSEAIISQLMPF